MKLEAEEKAKQREFQLRMKELEVSVNSQREQRNAENGCGDNNSRPQVASMKALKLPPFNEDKDDLDAYLSRFERSC